MEDEQCTGFKIWGLKIVRGRRDDDDDDDEPSDGGGGPKSEEEEEREGWKWR